MVVGGGGGGGGGGGEEIGPSIAGITLFLY